MSKPTKTELAKYKHNRAVLTEIVRQKQDFQGQVRDWDVVRKISQQFSVHSANEAVEVGRQDRDAHERAWMNNSKSNNSQSMTSFGSTTRAGASSKKDGKKKKGNIFLFWQKK